MNELRNDRLNTKQKQKVLLGLKADFEANLTRLDTVYYHQAISFKKFIKSKNLIDSVNYVTDNTVFKENLAHGGYGYSYNTINVALRSKVSSGDIHLIESERLILLLFSWEDLVIDSYEEIEKLLNYATDIYVSILHKYAQAREIHKKSINGNGSSHPSDLVGLFKDPLFENYIQDMLYNSYSYMEELKEIRIDNLEIVKLIEEELTE